MASSTGQSGTGRTLRIVSPCRSVAEFLEAFRGYARQRSIFIPTAAPRRAGTTGRFRIELETGESLLIGNGTVVEAFPDDTNSFGAAGMKIEFSSVDDRGDKVLAQFDPAAAPANGGAKRPDCTLLEETITTMAFPALGLTPAGTGEPGASGSGAGVDRSTTMKAPAQPWQPPALRSVPSIPVKKVDPPAAVAPTLKPVPAPAPVLRPVPAPAPAPKPLLGSKTITAPAPAPVPAPIAEAKPPSNIASKPAPVPPPPGLARRPTPSPVTPLPGLTRRRPASVAPLPGVAPAAPEPGPAAPPFVTVIGDDYGKAAIEARSDSASGPRLVPNPPKLPVKLVPADEARPEARSTTSGWGDIDDWQSSTTDPYDAIREPEPTRRDRQSPLISGELESPTVLPDAPTQTRPDVRAVEDESPTETTAPPETRDATADTLPMSALSALPALPPAAIPPPADPDHDTLSDPARPPQPRPVVAAPMPPAVPVYPVVSRDHAARPLSAFENAPTATDPVSGTGMVVKTAAVSGIVAMVIGLVMGYLIWGGRGAPSEAPTAASAQGAAAAEAPRAPAAATAEPNAPAPDEAAPEPAAAKAAPEPAAAKAAPEPAAEPAPDEADPAPEPAAEQKLAAGQPPDPAVAPAAACSVAVSSRPAGAMVFAGKKKLGVTPIAAAAAPCGELELKLRKKYYQDAVQAVTAAPGEPQKVAVTLERKKATVRVVSIPTGATLSINGKRAGNAPHSLTLPAGTRVKLKLDKPGFKPWSRSVTIDKSTRLEAKLDPEARPKPKPNKPTKPTRPKPGASNRRSQGSP